MDIDNSQIKDIFSDILSPYCSQYDKISLLQTSKKWNNLVSNKRFWKGQLIINDNTRKSTLSIIAGNKTKSISLEIVGNKTKDYFYDLLKWVTKMGSALSNITHLTTNIIRTTGNGKIFEEIYSKILLFATITTLEIVATDSSLYLLKNCTHSLTNLTLHIECDTQHFDSASRCDPSAIQDKKLKKFLNVFCKLTYPHLQNYAITNYDQKILNDSFYYMPVECIIEICDKIKIQEKYPNLKHFSLQTSEAPQAWTKYNTNKLYLECKHLETLTLDYVGVEIFWENNKLKNIDIKKLVYDYNFLKNDIFNDLLQLANNDQNKIPNLNVQCCSFPSIKESVNYDILFTKVTKMTIICNCATYSVKHKDIDEELLKIRKINSDMQIEYIFT